MEHTTLRKVTLRLIPFLFLLYIAAYLTRINVSFAALQMNADLNFSDSIYGFGAGVFFFGYFIFEIPGNLILERFGARLWIGSLMIIWGLLSSAMMFVTTPWTFYVLRFFLGLAQAGFFPGMILYLTYWFPTGTRARAVARFMTATAIAGVVGAPLSGWILDHLHQTAGLSGWQWMFLLEGIPSVLLGLVVYFYLTDRPEQATWLNEEERAWLVERMQRERAQLQQQQHFSLLQALTNMRVWLLTILYFTLAMTFYGFGMFLPKVIAELFTDLTKTTIGLVAAIPYALAAIVMIFTAAHSDRTGERRWHFAWAAFVSAAGFVIAALANAPIVALFGLCAAAIGLWSTLGPFWALPTSFLTGTAAAGAIGLINAVGNLGGFVGPYVIGRARDATSEFTLPLLTLAGMIVLGGILVLTVRHNSASEPPPDSL